MTANLNVQSVLADQMEMQEKASKLLSHFRYVSNLHSNKGRTHSSYYPHDYVLVHKSRWPQRKVNKIQSPCFGPYLILEVRHNSLKVAVSPSLGGVKEVSTSMVKKWNSLHQDDPGHFDLDLSDIEKHHTYPPI